ncbi:MAG: hypothetical protein VB949_17390, partial [Pseudomonadales bacterium]
LHHLFDLSRLVGIDLIDHFHRITLRLMPQAIIYCMTAIVQAGSLFVRDGYDVEQVGFQGTLGFSFGDA